MQAAGAEIDLLLELGKQHGMWAIEIKRSLAPKIEKNFNNAMNDLKPAKAFIVYPGEDRYPKSKNVEVLSLPEMAQELEAL